MSKGAGRPGGGGGGDCGAVGSVRTTPLGLAELRQFKARYDRDNVFNRNFPIPPTPRNEPHEVVLSADRPRKESE
jgi:hypothetical protein